MLCDGYVVCAIRNVLISCVLSTFAYVLSAMCYVLCCSYVVCNVRNGFISLVLSRLCYALWSMRQVQGGMSYAKCVYFPMFSMQFVILGLDARNFLKWHLLILHWF